MKCIIYQDGFEPMYEYHKSTVCGLSLCLTQRDAIFPIFVFQNESVTGFGGAGSTRSKAKNSGKRPETWAFDFRHRVYLNAPSTLVLVVQGSICMPVFLESN